MKRYLLYIAWVQSVIATLGSLYFSEVMKLAPCTLCWYQRICMYPLTVILGIGVLRKDRNILWFSLPFAVIGFVIAAYHNLLVYNVLGENSQVCQVGVPCGRPYFKLFNVVTIPLMSLIAFSVINACLLVYKSLSASKKSGENS